MIFQQLSSGRYQVQPLWTVARLERGADRKTNPNGDMPTNVTIPVGNSSVKRLCFLNLGNHSIGHLSIAYYTLKYANGPSHEIGFHPFGKRSDDRPTKEGIKALSDC